MCRKKSSVTYSPCTMTSEPGDQLSVAIIGGGVSGILSIKACKEYESHFCKIVCYEKTSNIGGLWKYRYQIKMY